MEQLTIRALSRETAAVLDRVENGETILVTRGKQIVARIEPVRGLEERKLRWKEHARWLAKLRRGHPRSKVDPVDELRRERARRDRLR